MHTEFLFFQFRSIEKSERHAELEAMRQKNIDLTQKLDEEKKAKLAEVAACATMKANNDQLQQEKMQLSQRLTNEQMKVDMLKNTLELTCHRVSKRVLIYNFVYDFFILSILI